MNSLFMNQISEDTKANAEKNRFAEVFAREEKRRRQIREKDHLMQNLVNRFYRSIISAIWESANKGMYYCVIEFDITCFKYMPESYGGWGISLQERIEKNLISEHGLGKPNTIVHSLFSYISDTKRELKVNGVAVTNYLDDSLKYSRRAYYFGRIAICLGLLVYIVLIAFIIFIILIIPIVYTSNTN